MKRLALLPLAAALALAGGCLTKRTGLSDDGCTWRVGVTTRRDVVAKWGNPDLLRGDEWTWISVNTLGSKFKCGYMMIGFTLANSEAVTRETRLTFGKDGRLKSVVSQELNPGGAEWNPMPW